MGLLELIDEAYDIEPGQRLMLQALLLPAPRDRECFARWLAQADFEAMHLFSLRLVPALLGKHPGLAAGSPHRARMRGIRRYFLFRASLLFAEGRRVMQRLIAEGIDVLLFKGTAVSLKYHRDRAGRPMADVDALVRPEDLPRAEEILLQCGFAYGHPERDKSTDIHSHDYVNSRYSGFDLHWHALYESPYAGADEGLWQRAEFFDWDGVVVKLMSPEDLVLTSVVNGVREASPMRPQWIHDLACIVRAEPALQWPTVWDEARARGLGEKVFDALNLVRGISEEIVPGSLLEGVLQGDPALRQALLDSAVAEGRTCRLQGEAPAPGEAPGSPRHIRYFVNGEGAIHRLFLRRRHLPRIAELFEASDPAALENLIAAQPRTGEGELDVPPGLLGTRPPPALPGYSARIAISGGPEKLVLGPGEAAAIEVEVENDSPHCWPLCAGSGAPFGLSWHLLAEDGSALQWDWPRAWLMKEWAGYVAFVEPGQKLRRTLRICAPREPGRYLLQLDLVQEGVLWFSSRGMRFPRIELEVPGRRRPDAYAVAGPGIVHETAGHETVIIDTHSGAYYSANGYASLLWNALAEGHAVGRIAAAFASAGIFDPAQGVVPRFVAQLLAARLIARADASAAAPQGEPRVARLAGQPLPALVKHADPRELASLHPVRGASARAGWPHRDAARS